MAPERERWARLLPWRSVRRSLPSSRIMARNGWCQAGWVRSMQELLDSLPGRAAAGHWRRGPCCCARASAPAACSCWPRAAWRCFAARCEIALVDDAGAVFGEMSALLDIPHTTSVRAVTAAVVHVVDDPGGLLRAQPRARLADRAAAGTTPAERHQLSGRPEAAISRSRRTIWAWSTRCWSRWRTSRAGASSRRRSCRPSHSQQPGAADRPPARTAGRPWPSAASCSVAASEHHQAPGRSVSTTMCEGSRADLVAGVEHPGGADPVGPGAVAGEGRLVDMAGKDEVGLQPLDPFPQHRVAEAFAAVPADRRAGGRGVMHPDPSCRPQRRVALQQARDLRCACPGRRPTGRS